MILKALINLFRRLPIKSGLTLLSFNPIVNKLMSTIPRIATAKLRDGCSIEVDTSEYVGRVLFLSGTNDPKVEQTANSLLAAGDVFLDIGANYSSIGLIRVACGRPERHGASVRTPKDSGGPRPSSD